MTNKTYKTRIIFLLLLGVCCAFCAATMIYKESYIIAGFDIFAGFMDFCAAMYIYKNNK